MRLYLMPLGSWVLTDGRERRPRSQRAYLIQTDDGENILIDTGLPPAAAGDPFAHAASSRHPIAPYVFHPDETVPGQLDKIGLTVEDIDLVVLTHSDLDHIGGVDQIPRRVPVALCRLERELDVPAPSNPGSFDTWPDRDYVLLEPEDQELRPGIELLFTPGHTPGHFSVVVDLPRSGRIILTADAIKMRGEIPSTGTDVEAAKRSAYRLLELGSAPGTTLILGHDGPQWFTLKLSPEYYE